jgi:SNF2 family DNA or RNA helicase
VVQPLQLRAYQEEASDFLYARDRAMILAPVGAGKTAITLDAMQAMMEDNLVTRWLVVAPKRVCVEVWPVEAPKWSKLRVALAVGTPAQRDAALNSDADVIVINYDNLQKLTDLSRFDGIVFDELTRLKNPSGKRFKAIEKLLVHMNVRWGLTGSFTSNGLEDVFGQCKIIDQTPLGRSKGAFLQQYFHCINRDFGQWEPAADALPKVMARIKDWTFVLDAGEYADKLPPCHTVELRCTLDDRAPYDQMKKTFVAKFADDRVIAQNAGSLTTKLQQMASGFVYNREGDVPVHWFSTHKFDRLDELIEENQRANTLIWYSYQEELSELKRRHPTIQTADDVDVVARWNRGEIPLLAAHPKSFGHGINLQGQQHMVFLSLPWSLELYEQAVGRLHRGGQKRDVWVYVMMTEKTIDERIWAALHNKRAVSDVALEELKDAN